MRVHRYPQLKRRKTVRSLWVTVQFIGTRSASRTNNAVCNYDSRFALGPRPEAQATDIDRSISANSVDKNRVFKPLLGLEIVHRIVIVWSVLRGQRGCQGDSCTDEWQRSDTADGNGNTDSRPEELRCKHRCASLKYLTTPIGHCYLLSFRVLLLTIQNSTFVCICIPCSCRVQSTTPYSHCLHFPWLWVLIHRNYIKLVSPNPSPCVDCVRSHPSVIRLIRRSYPRVTCWGTRLLVTRETFLLCCIAQLRML